MNTAVAVEAIVADLRVERTRIDAAIEALTALYGLGSTLAAPVPVVAGEQPAQRKQRPVSPRQAGKLSVRLLPLLSATPQSPAQLTALLGDGSKPASISGALAIMVEEGSAARADTYGQYVAADGSSHRLKTDAHGNLRCNRCDEAHSLKAQFPPRCAGPQR